MTKLITKYHNDLNTVPFRNFNARELDLLFTIISTIKNEGVDEVLYDFDTLQSLTNYSSDDMSRFVKDLESTYDKLIQLPFRVGTDHDFTKFVLFTRYRINSTEKFVSIAVNHDFKYVLNDMNTNFTRFELKQFLELSSTYSKALYRLLKQFRSTGYYKIKVEEFRYLLSIPNVYRMSNIDQRVLDPAISELKLYFKDLRVKKIKAKKGRKIEYFVFYFEKEHSKLKYQRKNKNIPVPKYSEVKKSTEAEALEADLIEKELETLFKDLG